MVSEVQSALDTATAAAYKRGWDDAQRDTEYRVSALDAERIEARREVSRLEVEVARLRAELVEARRDADVLAACDVQAKLKSDIKLLGSKSRR